MHTLRILGHKPRMNIRLLMQRSPKLYPYLFPKEYHRMCQSRYIPRQPTGTETYKRKNTPVIAAKPKLSAKSVIRGPALPWPNHVPIRDSHRRSTLTYIGIKRHAKDLEERERTTCTKGCRAHTHQHPLVLPKSRCVQHCMASSRYRMMSGRKSY